MATYLYALIHRRNEHLVPAHIPGLGGTPLRVVECGDLGALANTLDAPPPPPTRARLDDVRAHDHAVQSVIHHGATAVAVRFGQSFGDDDALRREVGARSERTVRVLEEYDGCVEMRLLFGARPDASRTTDPKAADPEAADPESADPESADPYGPGTAYLAGLRRATNRDPAQGRSWSTVFGGMVRAEAIEVLPAGRGLAVAHLIARADEPAYRDRLAQEAELSAARVVGPLALYSFVGDLR